MGFDGRDLWGIVSAVFEACVNAVTHGRSNAPYPVILTIQCCDGQFIAVIKDSGRGCFPPAETPMPSPASRRGRGIPLMRAFMDEVTFDFAAGCTVTLKKQLPTQTH